MTKTLTATESPLAGLKVFGVEIMPTVIVDTREQTPLMFTRLQSVTGTLATGDYSVLGLERDVAIERKSIPDLIGSITRERDRFMREVDRLRSYPFARLLVIGSEETLWRGGTRFTQANPKAILHSLYAIEARGLPVVFAPTPEAGALLVERWAWWKARESAKAMSIMHRVAEGQR